MLCPCCVRAVLCPCCAVLCAVLQDPEDSEPMRFQAAALMQFAVKDIITQGDFVKVLGLGGSTAVDKTHDPRYGAMMTNPDDFLHFRGHYMGECAH